MKDHNSQVDREAKRSSLMGLFAMCGRGDEAAELLDGYLYAARMIPTLAYVAAVQFLVDTWTWPRAPQAGDIRKAAHRILVEVQRRERERERHEYLASLEQGAMSAGDARKLLENLKRLPAVARGSSEAKERSMKAAVLQTVLEGGVKM